MIRLSSIFSFKTLQGSFRPGAALWLALALVGGAEVGVRLLPPSGNWDDSISSFDLWADHLRYELKTTRPDFWLIGNSTLHYGVDVKQVEAATHHSACALLMGSGTFAGETAMLEYFLRRAPVPPQQVVFFLTQDDLNSGGWRAQVSTKYLAYDTWRGIDMGRLFRLDDARQTFMTLLKRWVSRTSASSAKPAAAPPFDGTLSAETTESLEALLKNYAFDASGFPALEKLARKYHFRVALCLMPVTDIYLQFHDQRFPGIPSADIVARTAELCARHGFDFHDISQMAPRQYELFSDPYHMNTAGRAQCTRLVSDMLATPAASGPSATPAPK